MSAGGTGIGEAYGDTILFAGIPSSVLLIVSTHGCISKSSSVLLIVSTRGCISKSSS